MERELVTKAAILKLAESVKKDLLISRTVTLKGALQEKSPTKVLYVLFRRVFRTYIEQGYEYVDGYNFREAVLRARLKQLEQEVQ